MSSSLQLKVHGKGNAWPVPLGETHPYYDRTKPGELSNAAFSLDVMEGEHISNSILVDAGHGTIQSLITGSNRIPDCVCLTHGHMDLLVVDTNNRFPWPRTNHWSFAGDAENHMGRSERMMDYYGALSWDQLRLPHQADTLNSLSRDYLKQVGEEWSLSEQPLSIMEFLQRTEALSVMPVHYSGAEDLKHHGKDILSQDELSDWIQAVSSKAGLVSGFVFPEAGEVMNI